MEKLAEQIEEVLNDPNFMGEFFTMNKAKATLLAERLYCDEDKIEEILLYNAHGQFSFGKVAHAISQSPDIIKLRGEE